MKTVVFYNHCNNGDLHLSRALVRYVMKVAGAARYVYCHRRSPRILADTEGLEQVPLESVPPLDQESPSHEGEFHGQPAVFLNTWYAVSPVWNKGAGFGCTLNTLHALFAQHLKKHFGHALTEPVEAFMPEVTWAAQISPSMALAVVTIAARKEEAARQTVLVCNGAPLSGQSRLEDGPFYKAVGEWIGAHPKALFLVSNKTDLLRGPNVQYTADLIGLPPGECDLVENGYLSTLCDVIVGRASGAYSFAYLKNNFLDPKKTMACFTDDEKTARWIYPPDVVQANILWSGTRDYDGAKALLAEALP